MNRMIKLSTDVKVNRFLTFPKGTELSVINQYENSFSATDGFDTAIISKKECKIVAAETA
jgi:hypothetical protein